MDYIRNKSFRLLIYLRFNVDRIYKADCCFQIKLENGPKIEMMITKRINKICIYLASSDSDQLVSLKSHKTRIEFIFIPAGIEEIYIFLLYTDVAFEYQLNFIIE